MPEDEEEVETEATEEPESTEEPEPPPKKFAGKYGTYDDLEVAYLAEQSKLTQLAQENAELKKAQTTQTQPQNPPVQPARGNPWEGAFESEEELGKRVEQSNYAIAGQLMSIMRNADANIENLLMEREADPMFKEVGRLFRAELKRVEPQYMVDPNQAATIAENVYNSVCGKHARTILAKTRENPAERKKYLQSLGVEEPQPKDDGDAEAVTRSELDMLRGLGLTKKSREQVIRRVAQSREEEED